MTLGDFLVAYLRRLGVTHVFGIPGDRVIHLLLLFGQPRGLQIVTFTHEPGVGFAAHCYGPATRRVGAVCVASRPRRPPLVEPVA